MVDLFTETMKELSSIREPAHTARPIAQLKHSRYSSWGRVEKKWNEIQVGRQGSYSVERLESLDLYCKNTSQVRVLLVCLLTPIPALATALLLECLPLRQPSEGVTANWVFWLRLFLMELMLGIAGNSQVAAFVPGLDFTISKRITIALGVSMCYLGTCLLAASLIGFPVPLMMQFGVIPISILTPLITRIILGPALVAKDSPFKKPSDTFHRFFFAHMTLIGVYPLYKVLYNHVPLAYRSIVVIALPIWKFAAKSFVVQSSRQLEDYMPELVAFSVDFFGTLFVSVCMYTSGSIYLSGLFILADVGQSLLEFREVYSNAKAVLELLEDRHSSQEHLPRTKSRRLSRLENTELLTMIVSFTRNPRAYNVKWLDGARLWSCLPHPITQEQLGHLQMLEASGVYVQGSKDFGSKRPNPKNQPRFSQRVSVAPVPASPILAFEPSLKTTCIKDTQDFNARRTDRPKELALQGLQLLFHCEYLALVEYVECVVPLVFATYRLILRQLPNAIYYPNDDENWSVASVVNLLVFAMLESEQGLMGDSGPQNEARDATTTKTTQPVSQGSRWNRFEEYWNRIQVGRQGSYSVERLELLEHYCKTTSRVRVFLVCVLTPLPVLTVAVLLECLPLRPPSEGWAANWMFWIRVSLMIFTLSIAGFPQINAFIPGFNLSLIKMIAASLGICIAQTGTYLLEGIVFGFPVPFMWQLGAITMAVYAPAVTRLVFGPGLFKKGTLLWLHHERFQRCFFVHLALTGVYPLYKVLYDLIPQGYRGAVVVVLPMWKFAAKHFVVHATRDLEDFIPELVAFSVDFFSALFLSVCMTTSGSIYLSALFIAADICQCMLEFREVRNNAMTLLQLVDARRKTEERLRMKNEHSSEKSETPGLLAMILEVARNPSSYQVTSLDGARLWASPPSLIPHKLLERMQILGES
ncbi:hypothetical protein L914_09424, partial [Phytophthora nicotianae]